LSDGQSKGILEEMDSYFKYVRPELARLLSLLKLDIVYEAAEQDRMYFQKDGVRETVYDFLGGYGSTILGHNHPEILEVLKRCQEQKVPQHSQASLKISTARLGRNLNQIVQERMNDPRDFVMTLGNSGAEAVEIALKHCHLEWNEKRKQLLYRLRVGLIRTKGLTSADRAQMEAFCEKIESLVPVMLSLRKSFHGKTTGAVSVTENGSYRKMFSTSPLSVEFIDNGDVEGLRQRILNCDLQAIFRGQKMSFNSVAGFIYEPIQGEGGLDEVDESFLKTAYDLLKKRQIPLICDEIQSGLFRTGKFLCSEWQGWQPDYILLGKSFGGGVAKISAALIARDHYLDEFGWIHTSTFAEDEWSSLVAVKTLEILLRSESEIVSNAHRFESRVRNEIETLQGKFPGMISKVKGRGFFLGVEFNFDETAPVSTLLQAFYDQGHATYIYTSFLLHRFGVRVGVTLSDPSVVRLEPNAFISEQAVTRLLLGMKGLCEVVSGGRTLELTEHWWNQKFSAEQLATVSDVKCKIRDDGKYQVGFLTHILDETQARKLDKCFQHIELGSITRFLTDYSNQAAPFRYFQKSFYGLNGEEVVLNLYGLMQPSAFFEKSLRAQNSQAFDLVQEAVDLAESDGMKYLGLGQFTSIVSENGLLLKTKAMPITTGNSLTAAMTIEAIKDIAKKKNVDLKTASVGIVGFTGNICNVLTQVLAEEVNHFVLIHREPYEQSPKFQEAVEILRENTANPGLNLKFSHSVEDLKDCEIVIVGTNSSLQFIRSSQIREGTIVADISVPSNVDPEVKFRKDVVYFQGGVAHLPQEQFFGHSWSPLSGKEFFACIAETIVLGLLKHPESFSLGRLTKRHVLESLAFAHKVGVTVGGRR
jgi:acetylornithine/succinyldiaminopimelate/putrescine aminotransferase/predicted amino acid dehydrogenase